MGAHFYDLAAGTASPRSYEFARNDDVIAMNQFARVLTSASEGVASALNTETKVYRWLSSVPYGEMIGLKQGYIKRAGLAWCSDHHHNPSRANIPYEYSYLFGYAIDLPPAAKVPIPERVALLGFDDFELASAVRHSISVVQQPVEKIGRVAAELLFEKLLSKRKGNSPSRAWRPRKVILETRLILRSSCGCTPGSS